MSELPRIVIVGAGPAGMCSAERLRELGFDGELVIVGAEPTMPVYRPALSKQFVTGALGSHDLALHPADDLDATWRLNTPVSQLDSRRRVVHLPGGEELGYDGLVIATGAEARRMPGRINAHRRVTVLRTVADTKRLHRTMSGTRAPVVVLGCGFLGCEVAASLRAVGREVTIVGRSSLLMSNLLDEDLARRLTDLHRRNEVGLELGVKVDGWDPGPDGIGVLLSTGKRLEAAGIVVAVGSVPAVSWLRDSGAQVEDGLLCEPTCHVAGLDDVVAAGDVAKWPNLRFGTEPHRVEHWVNAIEMGRAAAENLLSGRETATPFMPVPRFWSEQHGLRIQAAGMPVLATERVRMDSDSARGRSLTGFVRDGKLVGVIGFDRSAAVLAYANHLPDEHPILARSNSTTMPDQAPRRQAPATGHSKRVSFVRALRGR
ncbi:NAD(P)/FAD-dependent oxidoreductase [Amycolatopsis sp. NPDC059027]|uniref:NAD(P)/FAD-dependent oxidoreductase n=1 Tax=unclassified Amycolatopsis TaxID=2618356 RepID=UPI00366BF93B